MKKILVLLLTAVILAPRTGAQTLFTYGKYAVPAGDFIRAFQKNNTQPATSKARAMKEYLELYINSRLRIREALERRYDTLPQLVEEMKNLREQIALNYMNDPALMARLEKEAFERSQKDIFAAHIFVSFTAADGKTDTAAAAQKLKEVLTRLKNGDDFSQVARDLSDDPEAKKTGGEIGFITVFTLPYEFENAVYQTPAGKYSEPVRSQAGYHLFKVIRERKAVGKMKAQQILLAYPPGADEQAKKKANTLADSLYKRIMAGDNFNLLAGNFSSDFVTAANGGIMPDINVGQYDTEFERTLWSLQKDGEVSRPFSTSHGIHIVKRISLVPVVTDPSNKSYRQELQVKILGDPRSKASRDFIYKLVKEKGRYKTFPFAAEGLRNLTDSILDQKPLNDAGRKIGKEQALFSLGDSVYTPSAWFPYAAFHRYKKNAPGNRPFEEIWDEFVKECWYNHYRAHLEDFNDDFRYQMAEFRDGNLFFEIMQQEIWGKAQTDTAALRPLYEKNKNSYTWLKPVDAVLFFCSDEATAKRAYEEIKKEPAAWRRIIEQYNDKIVADSSRYEWGQLPSNAGPVPIAGIVTAPVINTNDNTASFACVFRVLEPMMQRSFSEARSAVIADYQVLLETKWTEALRKKYPVVINQKVLEEISK